MGFFDSFKSVIDDIAGDTKPTQAPTQQPSAPTPQVPTPAPAPAPAPAEEEGLYSDKIEKLINIALADGDLTEKEKQVLFKKAEAEGIDLDEFEMVLEARLYEKTKEMLPPVPAAPVQAAPVQTAAPKSDKFGDIKKCPNCGAIVESFTTRCSDCGFEFRNDQANASIQQLFDLLMKIDNDRKEVHASLHDKIWNNDSDEDAEDRQEERLLKRKVQVIKSFPIPTSRENVIEFLIQAVPLSKAGFFADEDVKELARAWKSKCEQVIMKAKFALADDKALFAEIQRYAKELKIKI